MPRHLYLDASPPPYEGPRDRLDKDAFKKKLTVLGARVAPEKTRILLKAHELKECVQGHASTKIAYGPFSQPGH